MTPTELASLEALAKAATQWSWRKDVDFTAYRKNDLNFIAAANPAAILSLIEENKRMREALTRIRKIVYAPDAAAQAHSAFNLISAVANAALEPQS